MTTAADDLLRALAAGDADAVVRAAVALTPAARPGAIERLLGDGDAAGLAALDAPAVPRDLRKEARRALHRLRARGVTVPVAPRTAVLPEPAREPEAVAPAGFLGVDPPDALLLLETHPGGRHALALAVLDGRERVVGGFVLPDVSRRQLRELRRQYVEDGRIPVSAVPAGHVVERIRASLRREPSPSEAQAERARNDLGEGFAEIAAGIEPAGHPALELFPDDLHAIAGEARRLFDRIEGSDLPVVLDAPPLERLLQRLDAASRGPLLLSPSQVAEREAEQFRAFAVEGLAADEREGLAQRLLDRAWLLHRRDRDPDARGWAAAGALVHRFPGDPRTADLLAAWLRLQVHRADVDADGRERPPSPTERSSVGLILPGAERGPDRGSGGGLILP